jgi:hypothetical protein
MMNVFLGPTTFHFAAFAAALKAAGSDGGFESVRICYDCLEVLNG